MKKLLKNVFCGTHEQCIKALFTTKKSKSYGLTKKKKKFLKRKRASGKQNALPKRTLSLKDLNLGSCCKKKVRNLDLALTGLS